MGFSPDAQSGGGGAGLPSQWSDGGHGNVTASADPTFEPLVIASPDNAAAGTNTLDVTNSASDHLLTVYSDGSGAWTTVGTGTIRLRDINGARLSFDPTGRLQLITGLTALYVWADGVTYSGLNAAPADGDLAAGDFALWYDSTNGASALKVKAKQADGTVKTATIPLT